MALNLNAKSELALVEEASGQLKHPSTEELLFDEVKGADGEVTKLPVEFFVNGPASKVYRAEIMKIRNRNIKRKAGKETAEKQDEDWTNLTARCTEKISNLSYKDKPCDNYETIKALYEDPAFSWIKDQASELIGGLDNFLSQSQNG